MENIGYEPCFWSMTAASNPGYNLVDRERIISALDEQGHPIERKEKFPARGHLGDYSNRQPAPGQRYATVVRHDGNIAHVVLTNAAAHLDPNTPYGQYVKMKGYFLGWFDPGSCPAALVAAGALRPEMVLDKSILSAVACQRGTYSAEKPCPHCVSELGERRRMQRTKNDQQAEAAKNAADRTAEAQGAQTGAIVAALEEQRAANKMMAEQNSAQIAALMAILERNGISLAGDKKK